MQAALDAFEVGEDGRVEQVEQVKPGGSDKHPQSPSMAHEMCVRDSSNCGSSQQLWHEHRQL